MIPTHAVRLLATTALIALTIFGGAAALHAAPLAAEQYPPTTTTVPNDQCNDNQGNNNNNQGNQGNNNNQGNQGNNNNDNNNQCPPKQHDPGNQDDQAQANGDVTTSGSGWKSDSDVTLELRSTPVKLAVVRTDANGNFKATVHIPAYTPPGTHSLVAIGPDPSGRIVESARPLRVAASAADSTRSGLPRTGASIAALTLIGLVSLGVGVSLVVRARRRVPQASSS
jgi:LPXTG-motif cell wall-anchored protein